MTAIFKGPLVLDATLASATVSVPRTLLDGSSSEVDKNASAITFSFRLEPRSEADARKAVALAPAAVDEEAPTDAASASAKPPPPAASGPSSAVGPSSSAVPLQTAAPAAAARVAR